MCVCVYVCSKYMCPPSEAIEQRSLMVSGACHFGGQAPAILESPPPSSTGVAGAYHHVQHAHWDWKV